MALTVSVMALGLYGIGAGVVLGAGKLAADREKDQEQQQQQRLSNGGYLTPTRSDQRADEVRVQARPRSAGTTTSHRFQTRPRASTTTTTPNVIPAQPQPVAATTSSAGDEQMLEFARECIICTETYTNIDDFPPPHILPECSTHHSMDTCRACLTKHLQTQVGSKEASIWEQLPCPKPDCGHFYTHEQVRCLADADTFALYDEYGLQNILAKRPSFRRCLRPGCGNGQSYEVVGGDSSTSNKMECSACGFAMCFKHQCPWHEGLSCEKYDSRRQSGVEQTELWLADNTKPCPGPDCRVPILKDGGCWHMTCRSCKFEFCWNCLADWSKIRVDRKWHKPDCWFRDERAPLLTEVVGNTLEEAQRSRY